MQKTRRSLLPLFLAMAVLCGAAFAEPGATHYAQELSDADASEGSWLGNSIAIGGTTIVAGANLATIGSNSQQGAAYVFGQ
jgi:hypothetical protein